MSLGYRATGMRDPIENTALLKPKIWVPIHQTTRRCPPRRSGSRLPTCCSCEQMAGFLTPDQRPEYRWMVDPDDYLKPMVYDPKDVRRKKRGVK